MFLSYISIYNFISILVCVLALINTMLYYLTNEGKFILYVSLCQTFFLMEIVNIRTKFSKSTLIPTTLQLTSRLFIAWFICYMHDIMRLPFTIMSLSWFVSDGVRYLFYLTKSKYATALRYNMFIVLYPLGASLEVLLMGYVARQYTGLIRYILVVIAAFYVPGFIFLFGHMLKQRATVHKRNIKSKSKMA